MRGKRQYCDKMRELSGALNSTARTPDYLEATVYSKDEAVIMVGNFAEVDNLAKWSKVNHVSRW